ncbi:MAG: transglycosylase family protein [Solirubrobacterales bacterium]
MYRKIKLAVASCALGVGMTAAAQAAEPQLKLVEQPADRFERSIETHNLEVRYGALFQRAERLDAEPQENLIGDAENTAVELRHGIEDVRERIERAERRRERADEQVAGLAPGVSLATLNAIAACESGGDPTAVNPAGYYGKYQFDTGTWASVGGSGNPAEASEAEQDYRASLLYSRAGSSPWPVCGA